MDQWKLSKMPRQKFININLHLKIVTCLVWRYMFYLDSNKMLNQFIVECKQVCFFHFSKQNNYILCQTFCVQLNFCIFPLLLFSHVHSPLRSPHRGGWYLCLLVIIESLGFRCHVYQSINAASLIRASEKNKHAGEENKSSELHLSDCTEASPLAFE